MARLRLEIDLQKVSESLTISADLFLVFLDCRCPAAATVSALAACIARRVLATPVPRLVSPPAPCSGRSLRLGVSIRALDHGDRFWSSRSFARIG